LVAIGRGLVVKGIFLLMIGRYFGDDRQRFGSDRKCLVMIGRGLVVKGIGLAMF